LGVGCWVLGVMVMVMVAIVSLERKTKLGYCCLFDGVWIWMFAGVPDAFTRTLRDSLHRSPDGSEQTPWLENAWLDGKGCPRLE
jgi:hypothetical protein